MPMTLQTPVVTQPSADRVCVQVGAEALTFPLADLTQIAHGHRDPTMLVLQIYLILLQAGLDPLTAPFAEVAATVEAAGLYWGN